MTNTFPKTLGGGMPLTFTSRYSSDCIVDFLITLFKIPKSEFTEAIHVSIQNLDRLAREVDYRIDSRVNNIPILTELELKVVGCLAPFAEIASIDDISNETMKCVGESLAYNSTERSLVYSFTGPLLNHRTTLWYLYPLYTKLFEGTKHDDTLVKDLFILVTNYIQFLDDICDLIDDKEQNVVTPATIHFQAILKDSSNSTENEVFTLFMEHAGNRSNDFLAAIKLVADSLKVEPKMFSDWELQTKLIQIGQTTQRLPKRVALKEFQRSLPQILCYWDGNHKAK